VKAIIKLESGFWVVVVNSKRYRVTKHGQPLTIRTPLVTVGKALKEKNPQVELDVDPGLSENPFLHKYLKDCAYFDAEPELDKVELMVNSGFKLCRRCQGETWYDLTVRSFKCPACGAIESLVNQPFNIKPRQEDWKT
jgi:hypothetical protein